MQAMNNRRGGVFFTWLWRHWKTFQVENFIKCIEFAKEIVLAVALNGITSLLLPGGRTTRSKFKIPIPTLDNSTCNIEKNSEHSHLLVQTYLKYRMNLIYLIKIALRLWIKPLKMSWASKVLGIPYLVAK